jgi:sugar fermentation stimulation protein A
VHRIHIHLFVLRRIALKGTYTLIIDCKKPFRVEIGRIGRVQIDEGFFVYTGSALGRGEASLERRIGRHCRKRKRVRWHVDFLTVRPEIIIRKVICLDSPERLECRINQLIISELAGKPVAPHAGATDCRCEGHLLSLRFAGVREMLSRLQRVYSHFGTPILLSVNSRSDFSPLFPPMVKCVSKYPD